MLFNRRQRRAALSIPGLIALGLGSRHSQMPAFVRLYLGDVLWGLFFALFVSCWPNASPRRIWAAALVTTELIELSQLSHAYVLDRLRATPLGGLLLGHTFLWSDVLCVALGVTAAALLDRLEIGATAGAH